MNFKIIDAGTFQHTSCGTSIPHRKKLKMFIYKSGDNEGVTYRFYKKFVIPEVISLFKQQDPDLYEKLKDVKWAWRQKCGCMCPCSPGFITQSNLDIPDIYVSIRFY